MLKIELKNTIGYIYKTIQSIYTKLYILCKHNTVVGHGTIINLTTNIQFDCVSKSNSIRIGKNCGIGIRKNSKTIGHFHKTRLCIKSPMGKIRISDNTKLNGVYIGCKDFVHIGKNCRIASGSTIIDFNGHETFSTNRAISGTDAPKPIFIGDNVWIGLNSVILKGTTIGNNSIVSAGSIVKGSFPENCIISGNPAKIIKLLDFDAH